MRYFITMLAALWLACACAGSACAQTHAAGSEMETGAHAQDSRSADQHSAPAVDGHGASGNTHGGADGHTEEHHGGSKVPELPNLLGYVHHLLPPQTAEAMTGFAQSLGLNDPMGDPFTAFETLMAGLLVIAFLIIFFAGAYSKLSKDPRAGQRVSKRAMFAEVVVLFFEDFFAQIFGKKDVRRHLPFVGTLFIYILVCNNLGLVFMGKAPTANLSFNFGMAILVFLYVHGSAIRKSPAGYLAHYPGALPSVKELGMGPMGAGLIGFMGLLFVIIHIMEAFIQPVSLSLRLFGNLLGKDVLLGVFGGQLITGVPLHTPFLFLGLLLGSVQALIFSLLSAVYITLWQPHEHHHEEHGHGHGHGEAAPAGAH